MESSRQGNGSQPKGMMLVPRRRRFGFASLLAFFAAGFAAGAVTGGNLARYSAISLIVRLWPVAESAKRRTGSRPRASAMSL